MKHRVDTWTIVGVAIASWALTLACGGKQLNDVGDVVGGTGGKGGTSQEQAGSKNEPVVTSGTSSGAQAGVGATGGTDGVGGTSSPFVSCGSFGGTGVEEQCFSGAFVGLGLVDRGPRNVVLGEVQREDDPQNQVGQVVLSGSASRFNANYPAVQASEAADTTLDFPAQLSDFASNTAEARVTRSGCESVTVGGRTIRVKAWWKLNQAVATLPTHGMALGGGSDPTWFEDSTRRFVVGQPETERVIDTLEAITFEHTFAEDDQTLASDIFVTAWALSDAQIISTLYVANPEWQ